MNCNDSAALRSALEQETGAISESALACLQIRSPLNHAIYKALRDYRMGNMCDDEGYDFPLVDLMSNAPPAGIGTGEMEMIGLADDIQEAIEALSAAPQTNGGKA